MPTKAKLDALVPKLCEHPYPFKVNQKNKHLRSALDHQRFPTPAEKDYREKDYY
jgi:hypothetical protein